jgi:hypothetical protein
VSRLAQVVSFSGGRTSAYLCKRLLDEFPRDRLRFVFMDTGAEHPKTYEFIRKVDAHFGLGLTCLRGDSDTPMGAGVRAAEVSIDDIGQDLATFRSLCGKYGTPTVKIPACTSRLKERTFRKWANARLGRNGYVTWIGVRADEPKRLKRMGIDPLHRFLAEVDPIDKAEVLAFWAGMPFDLEIPEWLGNCVFCVKKSSLKLAVAARDEPEMAAAWMRMLADAPDRLKMPGLTSENVYRGHRTLAQICGMYEDATRDELAGRVRSTKATAANSCSESCEVFVDAQMDLFEAAGGSHE